MKKSITAMFDQNTKNCHRFLIAEQKGIKGVVYVNKNKKIPDLLAVSLKTEGELEKEGLDQSQKNPKANAKSMG